MADRWDSLGWFIPAFGLAFILAFAIIGGIQHAQVCRNIISSSLAPEMSCPAAPFTSVIQTTLTLLIIADAILFALGIRHLTEPRA